MSLDELGKKIAKAAKSEADAIIRDAKGKAKAIKAEAEEEGSIIVDGLKKGAEREATQLRTEMSAAARQHNQKQVLIAKREELDQTWQSVMEVVGSAGMKGRNTLLKSLMKQAKDQYSGDIVLRPVALDRSAITDVSSGLTMGDDIEGLGGFVLEFDGGAVSLDYRFESRLQDAWDDNLAAVTNELFS